MRIYHAARTYFLNGGEFEPDIDTYAELKTKRHKYIAKMSQKQAINWNKRNISTKIVGGKRVPTEMIKN